MRTNVFETMYDIVFNTQESVTMCDEVFNANIKNNIRIAESEYIEKVESTYLNIVPVCDGHYVGHITISGPQKNNNTNDNYRILEQRVIGTNGIYYLFVCIKALPKEADDKIVALSKEQDNMAKSIDTDTVIKIDALSRMIDYYLDCIMNETIVMTQLNERDRMTSNDPAITIAKAILLYNSPIGKAVFSLKEENENEWLLTTDMLLTNNLRLDWLTLNQFKSNDKTVIFMPQIELKNEIFRLCNDVSCEDPSSFKDNYMSLFTKGDIYKLANYNWIPTFLAVGTNVFSTEVLNHNWKKYF